MRFLSRLAAVSLLAGSIAGAAIAQSATSTSTRTSSLPPATYKPEFGTMWTFDAPPLGYWKSRYDFTPDQRWLDHVRLSAVRIPGCSASFVSAHGLVMTNHHCGRDCTAGVSPRDSNYIATGFAAANLADEKKCPGIYADQLQSIENVTSRVRTAITASAAAAQATQRNAAITQIQSECSQQTGMTCQVVTLYNGGIYSLYRYRRFNDVRLVMAPEEKIAFFGGDPDNFTYPRYDLDLTLLRVYDNGQPYSPPDYLKWSPAGSVEGDLVFVVGNPGSTGRLNTVAQMNYLRDVDYPARLAGYARTLAIFSELAREDTAEVRRYQNDVFGVANSQKAILGYRAGLLDTANAARKLAFEREFRARINADPALRARYAATFDAIAAAQKALASMDARIRFENYGGGSASGGGPTLLYLAGFLVRIPAEAAKPDSLRLPGYQGARLANLRAALARNIPIDTAFEMLALGARLQAAQASLPPGDPFIRAVLNGRSPSAVARALVSGTKVGDPAVRQMLLQGGAAAIAASTDPMIVLARQIDPINRGIQARADSLNAIITSNSEKIGQALFAAYGTALPPDATFTLRISDGVVRGFPMNGTIAPYKTSFYGLYARSAEFDGKDPFDLPARWIARRDRLDMATPFDFVSTNDIIGGNSGSPVIDRNAQVVGLVFDTNMEGSGNRFIFSDAVARTVSVHSRAMIEALRKMYDGGRIADELEGR